MNITSVKSRLKKNTIFYKLNAYIKARLNMRRLRSLYKYYEARAKASDIQELRADEVKSAVEDRLMKRGMKIKDKPMRNLRIFWLGASAPQDNSGFLQALQTFGEVVTCSNSPDGYSLKKTHGMDCKDAEAVVRENSEFLWNSVKTEHEKKPIDLFIGQMWADVLLVDTLKKIQQFNIPTINVSMDDKLPDLWGMRCGRRMGSVGLISGLDLVLTTSPDTCLWYATEGVPAVYWPLASDPKVFYPREKKLHDVVFVGSNYGMRGELVRTLMRQGVKVEAFGPGWPNGPVNAERMAEAFGSAKIILGTGTIGYNEDLFTIKLRDFDAPMSGALYLTHRNPDLLKLFGEDKEIACYLTMEECVKKAKHYLEHEEERDRIAQAGLLKARTGFTWDENIRTILSYAGFTDK